MTDPSDADILLWLAAQEDSRGDECNCIEDFEWCAQEIRWLREENAKLRRQTFDVTRIL